MNPREATQMLAVPQKANKVTLMKEEATIKYIIDEKFPENMNPHPGGQKGNNIY